MREDHYFKPSPVPFVTAAHIGISKKRWIAVKANKIRDEAKKTMEQNSFDILPIESAERITHYWQTEKPGDFTQIQEKKIDEADKIYYLTDLKDLIRLFVEKERTFFFLTNHHEIIGMVSTIHLTSKPVYPYLA